MIVTTATRVVPQGGQLHVCSFAGQVWVTNCPQLGWLGLQSEGTVGKSGERGANASNNLCLRVILTCLSTSAAEVAEIEVEIEVEVRCQF